MCKVGAESWRRKLAQEVGAESWRRKLVQEVEKLAQKVGAENWRRKFGVNLAPKLENLILNLDLITLYQTFNLKIWHQNLASKSGTPSPIKSVFVCRRTP